MAEPIELPAGVTVFERGWLSANNILFTGHVTALVDSGYWTHEEQTLSLVGQALGTRPLELLLNTHLHSDHCGGNAALQRHYPNLHTLIPPGQAKHVANWDPVALSYEPTGQHCPPFALQGLLQPGKEIVLGDSVWQIHAAPGHDQHSVILFEPSQKLLISADALWESGFGVIFQELEGERAFEEVSDTLDLIESLSPRIVIPGHGQVFSHVAQSIAIARRRLDGFVADPIKHARHAAKVLLKFKLLELRRVSMAELSAWAWRTPYMAAVHGRFFTAMDPQQWTQELVDDLVRSGAAAREQTDILNR